MNDVMTIPEAAAYLRCDEQMLEQRVEAGEVAYVDDGDQILFLREDLLDYLRARRKLNAAPVSDQEVKRLRLPAPKPVADGQISFSPAQVSERTGIPYGTVLTEIGADRLVARKVGTTYYVHSDSLDQYLKCPDQRSQPVSTSAPTQVNGSSATAVTTNELAALGAMASRLRKKSSVVT